MVVEARVGLGEVQPRQIRKLLPNLISFVNTPLLDNGRHISAVPIAVVAFAAITDAQKKDFLGLCAIDI